jgi:hypothetical protein
VLAVTTWRSCHTKAFIISPTVSLKQCALGHAQFYVQLTDITDQLVAFCPSIPENEGAIPPMLVRWHRSWGWQCGRSHEPQLHVKCGHMQENA